MSSCVRKEETDKFYAANPSKDLVVMVIES